ncbi:MAG: amidase family protein [Beijerinckiaceae bacterium]
MSADPLLLPVATQRRLLQERRVSSVELLRLTLDRIDALNPSINAVVALDREAAAIAAAEADRRIAVGEARPLEGLPVTIKDAFDTAGLSSTGGNPAYAGRMPDRDAVVVERLRRAGAIILGKTNVPVFSGDFQSFNPIHGVANHPWNPAFSPGGSSGGAAAAVATGMASFEIGSDQGGSVRWPCATNGVTGLRTSWGLVSSWGVIPPPPEKRTERNVELVAVGPITRHASDLPWLTQLIAGGRQAAQPGPVLAAPRFASPKGLRVAVWASDPLASTDAEAAEAVRLAARLLADEGAIIDETARLPASFAEIFEVFALLNHWIVGYGLPARIRDKIASRAGLYASGDLSHAALQARGARMTPGFYQEVDSRRKRLIRQWAAFFQRFDVLICPAAPVASLRHDHEPNIMKRTLPVNGTPVPYLDFLHWAAPAAGANLPAAVGPAGYTIDGLPRGVQIIAPFMEDLTAVAVAGILQDLQGGFAPPPYVAGLT